MGFEKLLMLINEKLLLVEEAKDKRELKIEEITRLKDVIASLKDNPFKLYELDTNDFVYVSKSLSLSDEYLNQLSKFKTIYEGFLKFGRDAIPQISLAENFVDATKKLLEKRTALLADKVAEYQYAESMERQYAKLKDEVISEDKEIASVDLLLELVNSSSRLSDEEKNNIKMEAIKKNNALYEKMLLSTDEAQMSRKINEINERLNETFKPKTLLKIKEVYKILSQCSNDEEIASYHKELGLAMSVNDLLMIRDYFKNEERDPSITEIKVIDTYWSDHCRHTTFSTAIENVEIEEGKLNNPLIKSYNAYLKSRDFVYEKNNKE